MLSAVRLSVAEGSLIIAISFSVGRRIVYDLSNHIIIFCGGIIHINLSGDRRINSGIFVGLLHHMAVCHNILDRFPGVADCKPRPHTTSSVSLGILGYSAYHYNPVRAS